MIKSIYFRIILYLIFWQLYLFFMTNNSPLGTNWLTWHSQRIYNFSQYLNLNGFFSNYGFSIWSSCNNCSLSPENWSDRIYLSLNIFSNLPYVIVNKYFGEVNLKLYGHYLDKSIIFFSGILVAELFVNLSIKNNVNEKYYKSILIFILFIINPWTYKMIIAHWVQIYFLFFFLLGILMIYKNYIKIGLLSFFISGCFDYQSSAGLFVFYFIFFIYLKINKKKIDLVNLSTLIINKKKFDLSLVVIFLLPLIIYFSLRFLALNELQNATSGSSLLERIGISGNDIHNGGLLGALQFLGGNRITICLNDFGGNLNSIPLNTKIEIFNCSLSILSMSLLSLISIFGLFCLYSYDKRCFNIIVLPLLFLLISFTFILQQSSSVHLMGYSYFFSVIFSTGISYLIFKILKKYNYSIISIIVALPLTIGIFVLCLRVSMLTGING